jgi:hypothetical protein
MRESHVIAHRDGEAADLVSERILICRKDAFPVFALCFCSHVLQRWFDVERHDVWGVNRHHGLEIHGVNRTRELVDSLSNVGFISRVSRSHSHGIHGSDAGHQLPTPAAQFHRATPNPLGAASIRTALPHMIERMRTESRIGRRGGRSRPAAAARVNP